MSNSRAPALHTLKRLVMRSRREAYGLRRFIPGLREHHRLEAMVGPLGYWHALQRYHLRLLRENGLQPLHTLLDLGCGPLQGGIAFIQYLQDYGYTGIDIDPLRIEAAVGQVKRHKLQSKNPRIFTSSTFGRQELGEQTFDFVWASQILYYFDAPKMAELFAALLPRLRPGGKILGDVFTPDHYEFKYPEHVGRYFRYTPESMIALAAQHGLTARFLGRIEQFGYPKRLTLRSNLLFEFTRAVQQ